MLHDLAPWVGFAAFLVVTLWYCCAEPGHSCEEVDDVAKAIREDFRRRISTLATRLLSKLTAVVTVVGLLDFVTFLIGAYYLGGDAVNGKIDRGRFYLYGPFHGTKAYHEVSHAIFDYSRWHAYSLIIVWPLIIILGIVAKRAEERVNS